MSTRLEVGLSIILGGIIGYLLPTRWIIAFAVIGMAFALGAWVEGRRRARRRGGPIVVCIDRSGSMYRAADWCSILALELLHEARARKRDFHVLYFNHEEASIHQYIPNESTSPLKAPPQPNGGTRYEPVLGEALTMCDQRSNIVFITDGMGERDPQMPRHDGIHDLRVDAVKLVFGDHRTHEWPIPFADVIHEVDGHDLPHPPDLVRQIARRF